MFLFATKDSTNELSCRVLELLRICELFRIDSGFRAAARYTIPAGPGVPPYKVPALLIWTSAVLASMSRMLRGQVILTNRPSLLLRDWMGN